MVQAVNQHSSDPLTITNTRRPDTDLTLKKVDKKDVNNAELTPADLLDGASFKIIKYKKLDPMEEDAGWNNSDDHSNINTGENGVFTFSGLTVGIYRLKEIDFPEGYSKMEDDPLFRVNNDLTITLLDSHGEPVEGNKTDLLRVVDSNAEIIVGNESGVELPHAGGSGTTWIYVLGALLTICSLVAMITKMRIQKTNN